jgi:hypothetical protein
MIYVSGKIDVDNFEHFRNQFEDAKEYLISGCNGSAIYDGDKNVITIFIQLMIIVVSWLTLLRVFRENTHHDKKSIRMILVQKRRFSYDLRRTTLLKCKQCANKAIETI